MSQTHYDATVIGSGPNGLAAAVVLAQEGFSVAVFEAKDSIGGGCRTKELTLPGYLHDECSAIHPLAFASPLFRSLPLEDFGLNWINPPIALAHPFDDGTVAFLDNSLATTADTLGVDGETYRKLMAPILKNWGNIENTLLGPLRFPEHPIAALRFGWKAIQSVEGLANRWFNGERAKGFFAGLAAHSIQPLDSPVTAGIALVLATLGHIYGWPYPKGGSKMITDALAAYLKKLGGTIITNHPIETLNTLPPSKVVLMDITPLQALQIAGSRFPNSYQKKLKKYRYGPGVFKIDWALNGPIPWKAKECSKAGTIHIGGTLREIKTSEKMIWEGRESERPYIILAQQSLFDPTRAPVGKQVGWAYCHVPSNSSADMTEIIENQVERFAPGFRDRVEARHTRKASEYEAYNPNCIKGDISGGVQDIYQLFTRPTARLNPYTTPDPNLFFCSSSTPPGGGVHGMCGYHAAQAALQQLKK